MADQDIKQMVKDRYGKAALAVSTGESSCCAGSACCGSDSSQAADVITSNLYSDTETAALPAAAVAASLGCGNPTALADARARRDGARPRLGRRHRRAALGPARRTDREGLRPRHDRRDAGAGAGEPAEGRRRQRRVPEGRDRGDPAAGQLRRRHHLQLRHQSVRGQGPRVRGGVPRAQAGRTVRRLGRRGARRGAGGRSARASSCGSGAWPARSRRTSTAAKLAKAGFEGIDVEPTRVYRVDDAREFLDREGIDAAAIAPMVDGKFMSAFVRARKPRPV